MARQAPARDRMSPLWQLRAHRHFGHCTAGRTRRARRSPTVDDSQRGPTDSETMHRLLLGHITNFRGGSVARWKRCYSDIGLSVAIFLLNGLPPKEKNHTSQINPSQVTDDGREEWTGYARVRWSRRWTANGRATLEIAVWMLAMGTCRQGQLCSQRRVLAWTTSQGSLNAATEGR